jgi:hypothetical protein
MILEIRKAIEKGNLLSSTTADVLRKLLDKQTPLSIKELP